ncbi:MAG: hypothetical protein ACRECX_03820 [Methyloceanibacter sp.]|uniref:hypothetical protein n=1 Tax=Methyloceanibacter sp. TaxID=1965321 RepID=UPI003D6DA718
MVASARPWLWLAIAAVVSFIVVAALIPVDWQVRLGLHWLIEHFLGFFVLTTLVCFAWPRPMVVAAVLLPFALLVEAAQMMTPDRVADPATALSAAAGVAVAALLADAVLAWRKSRRKA